MFIWLLKLTGDARRPSFLCALAILSEWCGETRCNSGRLCGLRDRSSNELFRLDTFLDPCSGLDILIFLGEPPLAESASGLFGLVNRDWLNRPAVVNSRGLWFASSAARQLSDYNRETQSVEQRQAYGGSVYLRNWLLMSSAQGGGGDRQRCRGLGCLPCRRCWFVKRSSWPSDCLSADWRMDSTSWNSAVWKLNSK